MITVEDFLAEYVRVTLSDPDSQRWTDAELITCINSGTRNISLRTELFTHRRYLVLESGIKYIDISDVAARLLRVQYQTAVLPFITRKELDTREYRWEEKTAAEPSHVVVDTQDRCKFTLYPRIDTDEIASTVTTPDGTIDEVDDALPILAATTSFVDTIPAEDTPYLLLYYARKIPTVTLVTDVIEVDEFTYDTLAHYVASFALRINQDAQNRQMAAEELGLYESKLGQLTAEKSKNSTQTSYYTQYNPMG